MVTALPSASANPLNVGYGDSALKDGSIASTSPLDIPNRAPAEGSCHLLPKS